jgi:hypothetical protein
VHIVRDYNVLRKIGELRYHQYVEAQGKAYSSMVLDPQCLIEPSDFTSVNIYAKSRDGITCAMRIGEVMDEQHAYRSHFAQVAKRFGIDTGIALTCTRLVRAPSHSGRHAADLISFVRWQSVRAGWRYCIMQTAERLVPFFRKFEFVETGIWTQDAAAGRLQVLIHDTRMRPVQGSGDDNA